MENAVIQRNRADDAAAFPSRDDLRGIGLRLGKELLLMGFQARRCFRRVIAPVDGAAVQEYVNGRLWLSASAGAENIMGCNSALQYWERPPTADWKSRYKRKAGAVLFFPLLSRNRQSVPPGNLHTQDRLTWVQNNSRIFAALVFCVYRVMPLILESYKKIPLIRE